MESGPTGTGAASGEIFSSCRSREPKMAGGAAARSRSVKAAAPTASTSSALSRAFCSSASSRSSGSRALMGT